MWGDHGFMELAWRVRGGPWQMGGIITFLVPYGVAIDSVMYKFFVEFCCT